MNEGDEMSQWHILMHLCINQAFPPHLHHENRGRENRLTEECVRDLVAGEQNFL